MAVYYRRRGTPSLLCNDSVENVIMLHLAVCKVIFLYWKTFSITFTRKKDRSQLKKNARLRLSSGVSRKHKDSRGDKNKHREEILDPNSYWYNKE